MEGTDRLTDAERDDYRAMLLSLWDEERLYVALHTQKVGEGGAASSRLRALQTTTFAVVLDRFAPFEALDRAFARYFADQEAEAAGVIPQLTLLRGRLDKDWARPMDADDAGARPTNGCVARARSRPRLGRALVLDGRG